MTIIEERREKKIAQPPVRVRDESQLTQEIAEAAYYLAERRGFEPGFELDDWLAAEAEVLDRYAQD